MNKRWSGFEKLANDKSVTKEEKRIQKNVFTAIREKWPSLYNGVKDTLDEKKFKGEVIKELKIKIDMESYNDALKFFAKLVEVGNVTGRWRITIPSYHQSVRRERSPFTSYSFKNNEYANNLNSHLIKILSSKDDMDNKNLSIIILISAIINGGVLTWEHIVGVCRITKSMIRTQDGLIWLDIEINSSDRTEIFLKNTVINNNIWRWYPDSMTAFLLLLWNKQTNNTLCMDIGVKRVNEKEVLVNINEYLKLKKYNKKLLPASMAKLMLWGESHLSFQTPGFLVKYAAGTNKSTSLTPLSFARVRTNLAGKTTNKDEGLKQENSNDNEVHISDKLVQEGTSAVEMNILKAIRSLIFSERKSGTKLALLKSISGELDKHNLVTNSLFGGVVSWIQYMLMKDKIKRKKITISSIYEYICALAPRLVCYGSGLDILTSTQDHFLDLYGSVLADCPSDNRRQFVSSRICDFHNFIRSEYGAVKINFDEIDGFMLGEGAVSANVITPQEYSNILTILRPQNPLLNRRLEISALIVMLGFRLGLRLGEVLRLTLKDLIFCTNGEILIRANIYGRLKTRNARRRLPIDILVPEDERKWLKSWYDMRLKEINVHDRTLLFTLIPDQKVLIRMDAISPGIHTAMRQVTGDNTVRYHIFRHSFANWLLIRLVGNEIPNAIDTRISTFKDVSFSDEECHRLRMYFFPQGYTSNDYLHPVRSALYQLAQMMGHSSPEISLKHYVHICDYLLGQSLSNTLNWLDVKTFIKLTNKSQSAASNYLDSLNKSGQGNHKFFKKLSNWSNLEKDPVDLHLSKPNLTPIVCEVDDTKSSLHADSIIEIFKDLWIATDKEVKIEKGKKSHKIIINGINQKKLAVLAKQKELNVHIFYEWKKAAYNFFKKHKTRTKNTHHSRLALLPNMNLGYDSEIEMRKTLTLLLSENETINKSLVEYGIDQFLSHVSFFNSEVRFTHFDDALKYFKFLKILEIENKRIRLFYLENNNPDSNEQKQRHSAWENELGLPVELVSPKNSRRIQSSTKYGTVGISVDSQSFTKGDEQFSLSRKASAEFSNAIQIFEILRIKNDTFTIHCQDAA